MSRVSLPFAVLLLVLCASQPMYAGAADTSCGIIWDEPLLLSDSNYNAHSPKIALSGDDTVHIVWSSSTGATRLPYVRSVDGGSSFGPRVELLADSIVFTGRANLPSVVAWYSNVYVFFQGPASDTPIRMVKSNTGGETWQYPVDITPDTTGPPPLTPTIAGDTIAMTYVAPGEILPRILRTTDGGLTWASVSSGLAVSHSLSLGSRAALSPGVLHLVQIAVVGSAGETEYRRSTDLGNTWQESNILSAVDNRNSADPAIATSRNAADSTLMVAWTDTKFGCLAPAGCSIISRAGTILEGSTVWGPEEILTDAPRGGLPRVSVTSSARAALWTEELVPNTTWHVITRLKRDTTWCARVDHTPTVARAFGSAVAVTEKGVHLVWHEYHNENRVFYRRGLFTTSGVADDDGHPKVASLSQNFPNPFSAKGGSASGGNPGTTIQYTLTPAVLSRGERVGDGRVKVSLRVYDALGRVVATLVDETKEPGEHAVEWNALTNSGKVLPSGVYYYRLIAGDRVETKKAILIK